MILGPGCVLTGPVVDQCVFMGGPVSVQGAAQSPPVR